MRKRGFQRALPSKAGANRKVGPAATTLAYNREEEPPVPAKDVPEKNPESQNRSARQLPAGIEHAYRGTALALASALFPQRTPGFQARSWPVIPILLRHIGGPTTGRGIGKGQRTDPAIAVKNDHGFIVPEIQVYRGIRIAHIKVRRAVRSFPWII